MNRIELVATAAPGTEVDLLQVNPDGTQKSFSVTAGHPFIVTDISIQRETVLPGPTLFAVNITQTPPDTHELRWAFVGSISQNLERSFSSGMVFSTPFFFQNAIEDPSAPGRYRAPVGVHRVIGGGGRLRAGRDVPPTWRQATDARS